MTEPRDTIGAWTVIGAAALMIACCAGPVLIAGGALSGLGAALRNPWLLGIGAAVILAALGWVASRVARHRSAGGDACC